MAAPSKAPVAAQHFKLIPGYHWLTPSLVMTTPVLAVVVLQLLLASGSGALPLQTLVTAS